MAPRDPEFGRMMEEIKLRLLRMAGASPINYAGMWEIIWVLIIQFCAMQITK